MAKAKNLSDECRKFLEKLFGQNANVIARKMTARPTERREAGNLSPQ
jgi:hypothetical protein